MKKNNKTLFITSLVCFIPIIIGLLFWNQLPDTLAIHFDMYGDADSYATKLVGILITPIICLLSNLFVHAIIKWHAKTKAQMPKIVRLSVWIIPIIGTYAQFQILSHALGYERNILKMSLFLSGFIFAIIGNYVPKIQPNRIIGIRIPWTLANVDNWRKTHRLGGFLWVIGGISVIISVFVLPSTTRLVLWFGFSALFIMILVPILYSWILSRKN